MASMQDDSKLLESLKNDQESIQPNLNKCWNPGVSEKNEAVNKTLLYAQDDGPHWREVSGPVVTKPLITKKLPKVFQDLPIHMQSSSRGDLELELEQKIISFIGDIDDEEYDKLVEFCDPKHLETGHELKTASSLPSDRERPMTNCYNPHASNSLHFCKNLLFRKQNDKKNHYVRKLKYRRVCLIPPPINDHIPDTNFLQPGKDLIFRVRVYRPFTYPHSLKSNVRHSLLMCEIVALGRQPLWMLRDRIYCLNDISTGVDVSENPDDIPSTTAKELFPSAFLFINNVFYVDEREGCSDVTVELRAWAAARNMGSFPVRSMGLRLQDVVLRLGHPDVYVHLGDCEHVLTVSEVRLAHHDDPPREDAFPFVGQVGLSQAVHCSTCAEHCTKWVVKGCDAVPFDPTYLCDACFRQYLYRDGRKVGAFKAFAYRGNEMNVLQPKR